MNARNLVLALIMSISSAASAASNINHWICRSSFGAGGPIQGQSLDVQDLGDGTAVGTLYAICPVCMIMPNEILFTKIEQPNTQLIYSAGSDVKLTIQLETLVPTRSFLAELILPGLNDGKPVGFTCVAL